MDSSTYSDPGIAANVNDDFVPVRVDVDRLPRVRERYATGGFPSTVFCTPTGEIIASAGYLDPDGFRSVLETVRERWRGAGREAGRIPRAVWDQSPPSASLDGTVERLIAGQLTAQWDDTHGGWGEAEKFPLPETIIFALKRERSLALECLHRVVDSLQGDDGAVYRHAQRDWSDPVPEVLTDTTAGVLVALAHAYCLTGTDRYRDAAFGAANALTGPLWAGNHVAASRAAPDDDGGPGSDGIDRTLLADRNAVAATGLLWLSAYTDAEEPRRRAIAILNRLDELSTDGLIRHHPGKNATEGLLIDQARLLEANVTATQILGNEYLSSARRIADATIDSLSTNSGPLLDAVPDGPGLLARPLRPLDDNAVAADAMVTLAELTGEDRYREQARTMLSGFAGAADRIGVQAARYGTATARTVEHPLTVRVATDAGSPLHRAALRIADHESVVVPGTDGPPGTAQIVVDGHTTEPVSTPSALADRVQAVAENTT